MAFCVTPATSLDELKTHSIVSVFETDFFNDAGEIFVLAGIIMGVTMIRIDEAA